MQALLEYLVLIATGIFAGAALYVSAVEHPARMSLGAESALKEFRPSYKRGAVMQASLAAIGGLGGIAVSVMNDSFFFSVGGALLLSAIPYTFVALLALNKRLMEGSLGSAEAATLLRQWGQRHVVRTALGVSAFVLMLRGVVVF
jgi:hypothetical protein